MRVLSRRTLAPRISNSGTRRNSLALGWGWVIPETKLTATQNMWRRVGWRKGCGIEWRDHFQLCPPPLLSWIRSAPLWHNLDLSFDLSLALSSYFHVFNGLYVVMSTCLGCLPYILALPIRYVHTWKCIYTHLCLHPQVYTQTHIRTHPRSTCQRWSPRRHCGHCSGVHADLWPEGCHPARKRSGGRRRRSAVHSTLQGQGGGTEGKLATFLLHWGAPNARMHYYPAD